MNQPKSEDEWPSLSDLPTNTVWAIGATNAIRAAVNREQNKEINRAAPYIVFSNVPPDLVDRSNDNPRLVGGKNVRIFYDEETRYLILKLVPGPHEVAQRMLSSKLDLVACRMGLECELLPTGSTRIKSNLQSKEPDSSWRPRSLSVGRTKQCPALVIETGYSESLSRLRLDGQWWITSSCGGVKVVIILAINPSNPQLVLEKWILDPTAGRASGTRTQEIIMTRGPGNVITTTGAPLAVALDEMFLTAANSNTQQSDIVVAVEALERIARITWEEQGI